jgi:hypothetical protein
MADTFSRESLAEYAKQPQTKVAEDTNPFAGATPAKVADPVAVAAVQSGKVDATPAATSQATDDDATPSGDADVTEDQTDSGDGTSDETADTSTAAVDSGDEVETPKKGSARERIVEVLDLAEGYKEYGKLKAAEAAELKAELARLKAPSVKAVAVPSIADTPMPRMEDPDVNFDADLLQKKTEKWIDARAEAKAEAAFNRVSKQAEIQKVLDAVDTKVTAFKSTHEDFDDVVSKNQVLQDNQLAPDAALAVARSEFTADLLYRFGQDPKLAVRTAKLSPADQREVIGEMIGEIRSEKKAAAKNPQTGAKPVVKKSITQASPPPTATKAAGRPTERDMTDPTVEMDDFARRHREGKVAGRERSRELRARR